MKKVISAILAVFLLVGMLSGCGGGTIDGNIAHEDVNVCPEDNYEIEWYIMADNQKDVHSIEEKMNEYLKDKLNVTVKLNMLSSAQYSQKMNTMINANEYFDLCFVARWMLSYIDNSRAGAFFNLEPYLDTYLKDITEQYGKENLEFSKVDGNLYALPVYKEMVWNHGWIYRKDIADKYGIDMSKYKDFESLEPVLKMIKEKEPDIKYPIDWSVDLTPAALWQGQNLVIDNYLFYDGTPLAGKTANPYEQEGFKKACMTAHDFYKKEYIRPDALTATDQLQRMKEGKTFVMLQQLKPGKVQELFGESVYEFEQMPITETRLDYLAGTGSMQAISATSKNPVRVMRFLNLLNTDPYLKNLVINGIEGKHYKSIDDNTIELTPGTGYDLHSKSWMIGNVFLDKLTNNEDPDKLADLKMFNEEANPSALDRQILSFVPQADPEYERMLSEVKGITGKYLKQCCLGVVDPVPEIEELNAKLEKIGFDQLLDSYQKEFDEFRKK